RLVRLAAAAVVLLTAGLSVLGAARLWSDPFDDNLANLSSRSRATSMPGRWSKRLDAAFGRDQSGGFYIRLPRAGGVAVMVRALRDAERETPPSSRQLGKIDALSEIMPGSTAEQQEKIRILGELRRLADRIQKRLDPASEEAKLLTELRPPEDLRPIG